MEAVHSAGQLLVAAAVVALIRQAQVPTYSLHLPGLALLVNHQGRDLTRSAWRKGLQTNLNFGRPKNA
jgi:hypothetical protein